MIPVAELNHCTLFADKHEDYFTSVNYLVQSHCKGRAWRITRHNFLGPEGGFLINGKGDSFPSAFSAAKYMTAPLGRWLAMPDVRFIDAPCGQGKTTRAIQSLDPLRSYIVVVPFIDEIRRWVAEASIPLLAATNEEIGSRETKSTWLRKQIEERASLVCTHALWDRVDVAGLDLSGYDLIVDEAFEVIDAVRGMTDSAFDKVYLADGWASVDPATGRVLPTEKWST